MVMKFDAKLITSLNRLSRLTLREQEAKVMANQLPAIVEYVGQLQKVNTTDVPLNRQQIHPLRPDETRPFLGRDEIINQAPDRQDDFWRVPSVF